MMRKLAPVLGALALTASLASSASAAEEAVCTVDYDLSSPKGYAEDDGHTFVGGLSTVNRKVTLERSDCAVLPVGTAWKVTGPGFVAEGTLGNLVDETVAVSVPSSNRAAGLRTNAVKIEIAAVPEVVADPTATPPVVGVPAVPASTTYRDIRLKRRVTGNKTDASPEPARVGSQVTVVGRFSVADWSDDDYVALSGRTARLQVRTNPGVWNDATSIGSDVTSARGYAVATTTAVGSRVFRFDFKGSATLGHADLVGDFVRVR